MEDKRLKAINIVEIENQKSNPTIKLDGKSLFHTGFLPGQLLMAQIYEGKIIIEPVEKLTGAKPKEGFVLIAKG